MTDAKIREVLDRYAKQIAELLQLGSSEQDVLGVWTRLDHLRMMIPQIRDMLQDPSTVWDSVWPGGREKLMRWLGFLQGALWMLGIYTIDELRTHNMPDGETFRPRKDAEVYDPATPYPSNQ